MLTEALIGEQPDIGFDATLAQAGFDPLNRLHEQLLELADAAQVAPGLLGQLDQLAAMIEGEDEQLPPLLAWHADLMQPLQDNILIRPGNGVRAAEQVIQFGRRRHRRRAGMARYHQTATGIGQLAAALVTGILEPAAEKTGHERIASAQHVEHFHPHAGVDCAVFKPLRNGTVNHRATLRAELDHKRCCRQFAHGTQGREQIGRAAGNLKFFFSTDNQVKTRQDALHMLADLLIGDKTCLAISLGRQAPEHWAIINIQHAFDVVLFGVVERLAAGLEHLIGRKMRAGDQQRLARRDLLFVDVLGAQSHVGAIFAVEHQGERFAVFQPQQHHGGQALGIALDSADITAFAGQRLDQEATHMVITYPAKHGRPEPQPGSTECDIGR
ncbi:hypothetical protein ALO49_101658 [Pseudomonas savastanoi pv. retacarpa]|nr:hypothetical protein ALO49_101658 [Pseudomonas savastanoi pv. retacarpa]